MKENSIEDIIKEKYTRYLNFETDILDLTLEEAKFILETDERRNYVTSILQEAGKVILSDYKRVLKENEELKEYIATAPNSDEMTATKYRNIQQDAYIQGRAEEQKKAEQIIYENYIPVQKVKDKIKEKEQEINNINSQLNTYKIRQIEYDKREKNLKNEINENVKRKINILKDNICNKIKNTKGNLSKDKVIDIVYKEAE